MNRILGVRIDEITKNEALIRCRSFLSDGSRHQIATVNPEFVLEAKKNRDFLNILDRCDLCLADGVGIVWAYQSKFSRRIERIPGADLAREICVEAMGSGLNILFLGGTGGVAQKAAEIMRNELPSLKVTGFEKPEAIPDETRNATDILLVGFGAPKQEVWISENIGAFPNLKIAVGVGGTLDYWSGKIKRAPLFLRRAGLEWLWRLMHQPWRIGRIFRAVVIFPVLVLLGNDTKHSR